MTVGDLIQALQKLPLSAEVLRGDTDWGGVRTTEVRLGIFNATSNIDAKTFWENYFPEIARDEDETPNVQMVVIR